MADTKKRKGRYVTALISAEAAARLDEQLYATNTTQHAYVKTLIESALLDAQPQTVGA